MKNSLLSTKKQIFSKYLLTDDNSNKSKTSDINVLLNRVASDKKRESRKKLLFSAATSAGVLLFGILIF